ncbi:hypothetical protein [Rhizocola hellebori]|nr:hypothetical protein [Rhizocola hellebori]
MIERLSPGSGGPLVDPDDVVWSMTKRHVDLRVVRRALRSDSALVLLGEGGGFDLHWVMPDQRLALWERVRRDYHGPDCVGDGTHAGYQFMNQDGARMLYLERWC